MVNPSSFPDSPVGCQLKIRVKRRVQVLYFVLVVGQIVLQYDMKPRDEKNAKSDELISLASSLKKSFSIQRQATSRNPKASTT